MARLRSNVKAVFYATSWVIYGSLKSLAMQIMHKSLGIIQKLSLSSGVCTISRQKVLSFKREIHGVLNDSRFLRKMLALYVYWQKICRIFLQFQRSTFQNVLVFFMQICCQFQPCIFRFIDILLCVVTILKYVPNVWFTSLMRRWVEKVSIILWL